MSKINKYAAVAVAMLAVNMMTACDDGILDPAEAGNLVPKTVMEDPALPAIEMNGSRFHLETFGDAANPVLIILHGGPGSDYRGLMRLLNSYDGYSLTDSFYVVMWDQRGAGLSQRHDKDDLTLDNYREDFRLLAERYSPDRPVYLLGHSWGGMYAALAINSFPQRVAGAVLFEPGPLNADFYEEVKDDIIDLDFFSEWLNDWAWSQQFFTPDEHARMDFERTLGARSAQPHYHRQMDVDPMPYWRQGAAVSTYLVQDGIEDGKAVYDFTSNLSAYDTKVRFVAGSLTEVIGKEFQLRQMQEFPASDLKIIDGYGHDMVWHAAAQSVAIAREYFESLR